MRRAEAALEDLKKAAAAAAQAKEEQRSAWERVERFRRALYEAQHFTHAGGIAAFAEAWFESWRQAARALREFAGIENLNGVPLPDAPGFAVARDVLDELLQDPDKVDAGLPQRFVRYVCDMVDAAQHLGQVATCDPLRSVFDLLQDHFLAPALVSLVQSNEPAVPPPPTPTAQQEAVQRTSARDAPEDPAAGGAPTDNSRAHPALPLPKTRQAVLRPGEITAADAVRKYGIPRATLRDAQDKGRLTHRKDEFSNQVVYRLGEVEQMTANRAASA